jgi:hypothetical protein
MKKQDDHIIYVKECEAVEVNDNISWEPTCVFIGCALSLISIIFLVIFSSNNYHKNY